MAPSAAPSGGQPIANLHAACAALHMTTGQPRVAPSVPVRAARRAPDRSLGRWIVSSSWVSRAAGRPPSAARSRCALGVPFADGDDLHPAANLAKMAGGRARSTDGDRAPWLAAVGAWLARQDRGRRRRVLGSEEVVPGRAAGRGPGRAFRPPAASPNRRRREGRRAQRGGEALHAARTWSLRSSRTFEPLGSDEDGLAIEAAAPVRRRGRRARARELGPGARRRSPPGASPPCPCRRTRGRPRGRSPCAPCCRGTRSSVPPMASATAFAMASAV